MTKTQDKLIRATLMAVAVLEGWDAAHSSIALADDGSWQEKDGLPVPSSKLKSMIERIMKGQHYY